MKKTEIPKNIKLIGTFKFKDKTNRSQLSFKIEPGVTGVIIEKVKGQNNKIIIAVQTKEEVKK